MNGGYGNDYLYGNAGNDLVYGNAGNDYLYEMMATIPCMVAMGPTARRGSGVDWLYGDGGNDIINFGGYADHYDGGSEPTRCHSPTRPMVGPIPTAAFPMPVVA
jgi:Ca2+-binding RTX toxin-like protein